MEIKLRGSISLELNARTSKQWLCVRILYLYSRTLADMFVMQGTI